MTFEEKKKKLLTLPWKALQDIAYKKHLNLSEFRGKEKDYIASKIITNTTITDDEIESLVSSYIYGDRITFTLWGFEKALSTDDFSKFRALKESSFSLDDIKGFRNLKFISIEDVSDRIELIYVYSKEYLYTDESGHEANVWEQHRGCIWVGTNISYVACISKHDRITSCIIKILRNCVGIWIRQLKPPKKAIDRCVNSDEISRIVLQGVDGEKTTIARAGGITNQQREEVDRIRKDRFDTSGSYIAPLTEDIKGTVKYNMNKGSLGIYKHLPAEALFAWTKKAIEIVLEEIENLKGKSAEEIFKEMDAEIKWGDLNSSEGKQMNWFLTQVISSLQSFEEYRIDIPDSNRTILYKSDLFIGVPRIYCEDCGSYEVPYCSNCDKPMELTVDGSLTCDCGAPVAVRCMEGHTNYAVSPWYIPTEKFKRMVNKNISRIYPDEKLEYNLCVMGDTLVVVHGAQVFSDIEIRFDEVTCFVSEKIDSDMMQRIKFYAVKLKEKCEGSCTKAKANKCITGIENVCIPKLFYPALPSYRPQPHKGGEYGDVSGRIQIGTTCYELKGIAKKNSKNTSHKKAEEIVDEYLLSTSTEGQEIIRQFVEQGMCDVRCDVVAIIAPQYFDSGLKGTIRYLAKISNKKVMFVELDEICKLISLNIKSGHLSNVNLNCS